MCPVTDKHKKWESAHDSISKLHNELEARVKHHAALLDRVESFETSLRDCSNKAMKSDIQVSGANGLYRACDWRFCR